MVDWFRLGYGVAYVTFAAGIVSSVARFYSRALVVRLWGRDDTASCVVFVVSIVHQVVLQLFLNLGCGKPGNEDCSFQSLGLLRTAFIEEIVIYAAHCVIKMTFLMFYLRLNPGHPFRVFVYLGVALNLAVFLASLLMTVFQCIPFEKILNPSLHPHVKCLDARLVMLTPPILNIIMDIYILCLPITMVWSLQMALRRKLTILSVLAFGLVSVSVAIVRLPVLLSVTSGGTDVSIDVGKMIVVASFEVQCAIIAVNLPSLSSLWTKLGVREEFAYEHISAQGTGRDVERERDGRAKEKGKRGLGRSSILSFTSRLQRGLEESEAEEEPHEQKQVLKRVKMRRRTGRQAGEKERVKDVGLEKPKSDRVLVDDNSGYLDSKKEGLGGHENASLSGTES